MIFPFYRWEDWGTDNLNAFSEVMQIVKGAAGIWFCYSEFRAYIINNCIIMSSRKLEWIPHLNNKRGEKRIRFPVRLLLLYHHFSG